MEQNGIAARWEPSLRGRSRLIGARATLLCAALLLVGVGNASAAVRYAAPAGTAAAESECLQTNPCSLFNAASRFAPGTKLAPGDEIVVEPGTYSDAAGDLGPEGFIGPQFLTSIHGAAGRRRPLVLLAGDGGTPGFFIDASQVEVSHLEIVNRGEGPAFSLESGTVTGVVARTTGRQEACRQNGGLIRDSACLSSGDNGVALGASISTGNHDALLRNVTAIATGAGSMGIRYRGTGKISLAVSAIGVLARGEGKDVVAEALSVAPNAPGTGATVSFSLANSDFGAIETKTDAGGGAANVTPPGLGTNITAEPAVAADGYHELAGSPTVDAGATDGFSGASDPDGNERALGAAPDIGADELATASTTALSCSPAGLFLGAGSASCTAVVSAPAGTVEFATDGPGAFAGADTCTLSPLGPGASSCALAYVPSGIGAGEHHLTAAYLGGPLHEPSEGSTAIHLTALPNVPLPVPVPPVPVPQTTVRKHPARVTSSRRATFTFVADQAGSHFECKLDGRPFVLCRSPFTARTLRPGRHTFRVRARNPLGAVDQTPAVFRWQVRA